MQCAHGHGKAGAAGKHPPPPPPLLLPLHVSLLYTHPRAVGGRKRGGGRQGGERGVSD